MSDRISPLEMPSVSDALSALIDIVEMLPEAQDPATELWAAVFVARESLREAMRSEPNEDEK